jgi:hypothetical protein
MEDQNISEIFKVYWRVRNRSVTRVVYARCNRQRAAEWVFIKYSIGELTLVTGRNISYLESRKLFCKKQENTCFEVRDGRTIWYDIQKVSGK